MNKHNQDLKDEILPCLLGIKNTVEKLFQTLDKQNLIKKKKFKIKIKKNIPQEAGLGGGSMNAASVLNYLIKKSAKEFSETYPSNVILFKEFNVKNRKEIEKIISKKKFFKKMHSDKDASVFNLVDNQMNYSPGSVEISNSKIIFTSFTNSDLDHVLNDIGLEEYISPSHISDPSEVWLNTKLKLLDDLTPLEAIKHKKYNQILEGILEDIFSIHVGREDENEISLDPYYIKKKLDI